jgi:peroxiredoxin
MHTRFALGLATLVALTAPAAAATVGAPAPHFVGTDQNGATHRLSDYRGRIVVLEWTNNECPFVGKHYNSGNMQRLQAEATRNGVVWLSVVSSKPGSQGYVTPEQERAILTERGAHPTAVLLDSTGAIGRSYGARNTPNMFVIDAQQKLVYAGAIDDKPTTDPASLTGARNYVRQALDDLRAGKAVGIAQTTPYGCSIKY